MLSYKILSGVKHIKNAVCSRNIGICAPAFQKVNDPIQKLFLDKLREYKTKSGGQGKLVDLTPDIEKEMQQEYDRVAKQFGGKEGEDMLKFPSFSWVEPKVDPINQQEASQKE